LDAPASSFASFPLFAPFSLFAEFAQSSETAAFLASADVPTRLFCANAFQSLVPVAAAQTTAIANAATLRRRTLVDFWVPVKLDAVSANSRIFPPDGRSRPLAPVLFRSPLSSAQKK
jgi:hypothetical protein